MVFQLPRSRHLSGAAPFDTTPTLMGRELHRQVGGFLALALARALARMSRDVKTTQNMRGAAP
jgi:hypothetical protein